MPAAARVGHRLRSVARIARFGVQALAGLIYGQIVEFTEPRSQLARCGSGTYFFQRCSIRCPHNITIGSNVSVGPDNRLWASPGATITVEDDVLFGPNVTIVTSNHGTADLTRSIAAQPWIESDVLIGRGAWLAANVVVLPGVTIGAGAVIAAGAVVAASIPPLAIAGGVPARVLKSRDDSA